MSNVLATFEDEDMRAFSVSGQKHMEHKPEGRTMTTFNGANIILEAASNQLVAWQKPSLP